MSNPRALRGGPWSAALSLALLEIVNVGLFSIPALVLQPGNGLALVSASLVGGVLGRLWVSRCVLPGYFAGPPQPATAWGPLFWTLGVGFAHALRWAGLLWVLAYLHGGESHHFWSLALGLLLVAFGLARWASLRVDALLFVVLFAASAYWVYGLIDALPGAWQTFDEVFHGARKHLLVDLRADSAAAYSLLSAATLGAASSAVWFVADPIQRARLLACGDLARARRALWASLVFLLPLLVMVGGGIAWFAWAERVPLAPSAHAPSFEFAERVLAVLGMPGRTALALAASVLALSSAWSWLHAARQELVGGRWWGPLVLSLGLLTSFAPWRAWTELAPTWGAVGLGCLAGLWLQAWLRAPAPRAAIAWAMPLVLLMNLAWFAVPIPYLPCLIVYALCWWGARSMVDGFGHRRFLRAGLELLLLLLLLGLILWLSRGARVPVERHPFYEEGWNWLPLSPAWYVPLNGWALFVLCRWFARDRAS